MEPGERTQDEGVERPVLHHASHELGADKPVGGPSMNMMSKFVVLKVGIRVATVNHTGV